MISKKIKEKLDIYNSLLGCIKYKNSYNFYIMPIAWWILDYKSYDPIGSEKYNPTFRNNMYTVDNDQIEPFLDSIDEDKITLNDLKSIIDEYHKEEYDDYSELIFFVDFDTYTYVSSFYDIEVEKYLPENWTGLSDNPLKYLSEKLRNLWEE